MKLTEAQRWALKAIADGHGSSPATLGQKMMERPGVAERRTGGNIHSRQGLGRIGGRMMEALKKKGLVATTNMSYGQWHPTKARLTTAGSKELQADDR